MLKREEVVAKLATLANTAVSIQATSAWLLFHKRHIEDVLAVWQESVDSPEASFARRLLLLYLANDVMQMALKKGLGDVAAAFGRVCPAAVGKAVAAAAGEAEKGSVRRLVGVWRERGVLPEEQQCACEALVARPGEAATDGTDTKKTVPPDPRLALLAGHWEAAATARMAQPNSRAAADKQRALADALFREAQLAVQELERLEAGLATEARSVACLWFCVLLTDGVRQCQETAGGGSGSARAAGQPAAAASGDTGIAGTPSQPRLSWWYCLLYSGQRESELGEGS
jgi:hypothetical protein